MISAKGRMKPSIRAVTFAAFLMLAAVSIVVLFSALKSGDLSGPDSSVPDHNGFSEDESATQLGPDAKGRQQRTLSERPPESKDHYVRQIWDAFDYFDENEASRCQIVLESKSPDATVYYLDVRPPSPEEVLDARRFIANLLDSIPADKREEMDERISYLIDQYDPFGVLGRRIVSIDVPDDPGKPLSAWTYPTEDVNREIERLLYSGEHVRAPENMRFYVGSEPNKLFRFRNLISQPEKELVVPKQQ